MVGMGIKARLIQQRMSAPQSSRTTTKPDQNGKKTSSGTPRATTPVGSYNVSAPGFVVEMYTVEKKNRRSLATRVRDTKESRASFVRQINSCCLDMGEYMMYWLKYATSEDEVVFVLRNMRTRRRAGIALCTVRPDEKSVFIDFICALEKRVGAGKQLIERIHSYAATRGLKTLELTSIRHAPTIAFYKKLGFRRGPREPTTADTVKARRMYKNMSTLMESSKSSKSSKGGTRADAIRTRVSRELGEPATWKKYVKRYVNSTDMNLSDYDGLIFYENRNESKHHLPKFHLTVDMERTYRNQQRRSSVNDNPKKRRRT